MKSLNQKKIMDILSMVLILFLLFYMGKNSISRLILIITLTIPIFLTTKSFSPISLFRILSVETALLPADYSARFIIKFQSIIGEYKDYFRTDISFSKTAQIFFPIFMILIICVKIMHDQNIIKKYIPFAVVMAILFIIGIIFPVIRNLCQFLFLYTATFAVIHLSEIYLYNKCSSLLNHLPFFFLYMTALLNIRNYF